MQLIERLEKRARELNIWSLARRGYYDTRPVGIEYDLQAADDRELLLEAAKTIRRTCGHSRMVALDKCWQCPDCGYTK